jgi:hypothetical protein
VGDWSQIVGSPGSGIAAVPLTTDGITVVANAIANTMGTWVELSPSLPSASGGLILGGRTGATGTQHHVDIGIGPIGFEVVVAERLAVSANSANGFELLLPLALPKEQRLAARVASTPGGGAVRLVGWAVPSTPRTPSGYGRCVTYGAVAADTGGTQVDPGGTLNSKGAWVELTSATTLPVRALLLAVRLADNNPAPASSRWLVDIGMGPAGSEQVVVPNVFQQGGTGVNSLDLFNGPFPVSVPPGTRIAARAQCSTTDATDRLIDVIAYGFS